MRPRQVLTADKVLRLRRSRQPCRKNNVECGPFLIVGVPKFRPAPVETNHEIVAELELRPGPAQRIAREIELRNARVDCVCARVRNVFIACEAVERIRPS